MKTRARSATLLALLMLGTVGAAQAQQGYGGGGRVAMSLVDRDDDEQLPQYRYRDDTWVPGTPGHRYAVRLANRTAHRVLVVLSVDGINAVSGQTASLSQGGYVLEPFQTTEVAGWRKSMSDVAQFYFADLPDSYAARTGRPRNIGVVGIAVFDEARRMPLPPVYPRMTDASPESAGNAAAGDEAARSPSAAPSMADSRAQSIGTGHGYREYAPVSRTGFVRASREPSQVTTLRYDDRRALEAYGITRGNRFDDGDDDPRAFPGGFVPDPPRGW